ncbi:MAG: hypothetical protein ACFFD8_08810 [Candidatus Thorarchaeota archaeon]
MSNETAGTLALIGGILNLIGGIILILAFVALAIFIPIFAFPFMTPVFGVLLITIGAIALIFGVFPITWHSDSQNHRVGLILIGALTISSIGGILILIAGVIATEEAV